MHPEAHVPKQTLAIAHRGHRSAGFHENTIEAIAAAIAAGADLIEIDIQICASGIVVVQHDENLQRIWGLDADIHDTPIEVLHTLRADNGQHMATLGQALELIAESDAKLLIDMAEGWAARYAAQEVLEHGLSHKVAWCGTMAALASVKQTDPAAEIYLPWQDSTLPEARFVAPFEAETLNVAQHLATPEFIAAAHTAGYKVATWTIDDTDRMQELVAASVDAITSNRIDNLIDVIHSAHRTPPRPDADATYGGMSPTELNECIAVARGLGAFASQLVRASPRPQYEIKRDAADYVTEIDVAIETKVRETLAQKFPDHEFCGEESGASANAGADDRYTWYLDPIDGTANLRFGLPWSSFTLAMARGTTPLVGVVVQVWSGDTFIAAAGQGAYANARRLGKLAVTPTLIQGEFQPLKSTLQGGLILTEWANQHPWPGQLELIKLLAANDATVRVLGSETLALATVAAGRATAAVIRDFNPIDHLAGALLVQEAGGLIINDQGEVDAFPEGGFIAIAPEQRVTDELTELWLRCLKEADKDRPRETEWSRPRHEPLA